MPDTMGQESRRMVGPVAPNMSVAPRGPGYDTQPPHGFQRRESVQSASRISRAPSGAPHHSTALIPGQRPLSPKSLHPDAAMRRLSNGDQLSGVRSPPGRYSASPKTSWRPEMGQMPSGHHGGVEYVQGTGLPEHMRHSGQVYHRPPGSVLLPHGQFIVGPLRPPRAMLSNACLRYPEQSLKSV